MRALLGIAAVFVMAALAVVAYSVATGKDLREIAKGVQKDFDNVDVSGIGKRINEGVATVEGALTERIDDIRGVTAEVETAAAEKVEEAAPA